MRNLQTILFAAAIVIFILRGAIYTVTEGKQTILTQFGKPIGEPKIAAGLYFKVPFMQEVRYLERRILNWDGEPNQVPTKDKKFILVDTTARWQINDPLLFIRTVQNEDRAMTRIGSIIGSATRETIASNNLVEAVRDTNQIFDSIQARQALRAKAIAAGDVAEAAEEEITGEIEHVAVGRTALADKIVENARAQLKDLGIKIIDVQLMRVSYEGSVEQKVYERMISERQRVAEKIRSVGKGEQAKIEGKTDFDLKQIQSDGYRRVQEIRGQAEAEAIKYYAGAIGENKDFYEFIRTMEAYQKGFQPNTNLILSADSDFLKLLSSGVNK